MIFIRRRKELVTHKHQKIRRRALKRVEAWLLARESPRFHMFIIVSVTGAAAFLFSFLMLKTGLTAMWARYPLAIGLAYGVFLALLRLWLTYEESGESPVTLADAVDGAEGLVEITGAVVNNMDGIDSVVGPAGDVANPFDLDEWIFVVIAIAALGAGLLVILHLVWTGPALLAEVFVDGLVMSRVYKKLKLADQSYWMFGALRRTWLPALLAAVFFSILGFVLQQLAPGATSIGPVISHIYLQWQGT